MRFWPLLLLSASLTAETPKPPAISDALKLKFFKSQSEAMAAQEAARQAAQTAQQKQAELKSVVDEIQKACGDHFQPQIGKSGDPECAPKPEKK